MIKIAVLIILLAIALVIVMLSFTAGRRAERAASASRTDRIDPDVYDAMVELLRTIYGAQPYDDPAYIPGWLKDKGQPVMSKIETARRTAR